MHDIRRVIRSASLRLLAERLAFGLVGALTLALAAAIALRLAQQLLGVEVAWWTVAAWGAAAVAAGAGAWSWFTRPGPGAVARRVDEGADLRDTLSTALYVAGSSDPWAHAIVETAARRAREVDVRRAVPLRSPRMLPVPLVLAGVLLVLWITLGPVDLFGAATARERSRTEELAARQAEIAVQAAEQKVQELVAGMDLATPPEEQTPDGKPGQKPKSPEAVRLEGVKRLTALQDQLERARQGAKFVAMDALRDRLDDLRQPGPGPLSELSLALAKGDFSRAREELTQLAQKHSADELSPAEQQKLAEQLKSLAQQLDSAAQNQEQLQNALSEAGLNPALAADPGAMRQAIEAAPGLSEGQKRALLEMAKADEAAQAAAEGMSGAMQSMSQGLESGSKGESMQGAGELGDQLTAAEMMAAELGSLEAAMSECRSQMAALGQSLGESSGMGEMAGGLSMNASTGQWSAGESTSRGLGQGGPGQGQGGSAGTAEAPENWEKRKFNTPTGQGPVIGTTLVQGEQIRGESKARFEQVVAGATQQAAEALEHNVIERQYHDAVKAYFGALAARTKAEEASSGTGPSAPPPATPQPSAPPPSAPPPSGAPK